MRADLADYPSDDRKDAAPDAVAVDAATPAGKSLIVRENGDKGHSLTENLMGYFYRLTWNTPLHLMRLKGRSPLRLLAAPDDPFSGDVQRGMAIRAGHFLHNGMKAPLTGLDFANLQLPPLFTEYLHSFRWLRDLAGAGSREQCVPIAEKLLVRWLDAHGEKVSEPAWRADYSGARLLFWAAHAPLILSSSDVIYRSRVLRNIARTARHLDRTAEKAAEGLPRLTAWAGVVAASLLIPDGKPRQVVGELGLKRAIAGFMSEDGGALSRSPLSQMDAIMVLTMLKSVYDARKEPIADALVDALSKMVPALQGITHFDGSLGSWQGSAPLDASEISQLIQNSGVRARPLREGRHWGYQRIPAGRTVVLVDASTPPVARHAIMGCASTLAFEMSHGAHRIIVNCGGAALTGAFIPAKLSQGLRATAAHSTLCLDDHNSTSVSPKGKLGQGVREIEFDRREVENATRLEMSHDGYQARYGLNHRRILLVRNDGSEMRGEDMLVATGRKSRFDTVGYAIRFHLGLAVEPHLTADKQGVLLRIDDGTLWNFRSTAGPVELDESIWVDGQGRPHPTQQIVMAGAVTRGGGSFGWLLKKMG